MLTGVLMFAVAAVGAGGHARRGAALTGAAPGGVVGLATSFPAAVSAVVVLAALASCVGAVADAARVEAAARGDGAVGGGPVRARAYRSQRAACILLALLAAVFGTAAVGLGVTYFWGEQGKGWRERVARPPSARPPPTPPSLTLACYIFNNTARAAAGAAAGTAATLAVAGEMLAGLDTIMAAVKAPAAAANPALVALNATMTTLYDSVTPALKSAVRAGVEAVARRMDEPTAAAAMPSAPLADEAALLVASTGQTVRLCIASLCADLAAVPGARSAACVCRPVALAAVRDASARAATGLAWAGAGLLVAAGGTALLFAHFASQAATVACERDALYGRGTRIDRLVDAKARRRARAAAAAASASPRSVAAWSPGPRGSCEDVFVTPPAAGDRGWRERASSGGGGARARRSESDGRASRDAACGRACVGACFGCVVVV